MTSRWTRPSFSPFLPQELVRGVEALGGVGDDAARDLRAASAGRAPRCGASPRAAARRGGTPSRSSRCPRACRARRPCATFGCEMRAATRASSRNMFDERLVLDEVRVDALDGDPLLEARRARPCARGARSPCRRRRSRRRRGSGPRKYVPPANGPVRPSPSGSPPPSGWDLNGSWARSCGIGRPPSVHQHDVRRADVDVVRGPRGEIDRGSARREGCSSEDVRPGRRPEAARRAVRRTVAGSRGAPGPSAARAGDAVTTGLPT